MAAKTGAEAGNRGRRAAHRSGDLTMSGTGLKESGDGTEELRPLEVIEERKTVLGERPSAPLAEISSYAPAASGEVGAVQAERKTTMTAAMLGAGGPWAESRLKIAHSVEGGSWPLHEDEEGTNCATTSSFEMH